MSEATVPETTESVVTVRVTFRDEPHFYRVINWMNKNVGPNKNNWKINKPVKKYLSNNRTVTRNILITKPGYAEKEVEILLNLM